MEDVRDMGDVRDTGRMRVVCAWCDASLGTRACAPEMDGAVSHGICAPCAAEQVRRDVTAESFAAHGR